MQQFWPFEEISYFSNSRHLGWKAGLSDIILKGDGPNLDKTGSEVSEVIFKSIFINISFNLQFAAKFLSFKLNHCSNISIFYGK